MSAFRVSLGSLRRSISGVAAAAWLLASAADARADVSSWLYAGGGMSRLEDGAGSRVDRKTFQLETGMGLPPSWLIVVGGLVRSRSYFGSGTDLALLVRTATYGYVNGGWGLALDLGPYQRWWGKTATGGEATLMCGAPWGITLGLAAQLGSDDARTYTATLGVDLARLTVYRTSGSEWWSNPFPAVGRDQAGASR